MHTWTISQCALVRSPEIFFFVASCLFFCFLLYLKFSHTFRSFFAVFYLANRFSDFIYSSDFSFTVYLVFGRRKFNFISCSILLLKKTCVYRFSVEDSKKKYIYPMPHRCLHCSSNAKIQCVTDPDTFIAWEERQQIRRWLFQMLIIKIAKFMGGGSRLANSQLMHITVSTKWCEKRAHVGWFLINLFYHHRKKKYTWKLHIVNQTKRSKMTHSKYRL